VFNNTRVELWDIPRMALKYFDDFTDGVHYGSKSNEVSFQV